MSDEMLTCVECGRRFTWTNSEQRFFKERGLSHPKRCPDCRLRRKADRQPGMNGPARPAAEPSRPDRRRPAEAERRSSPPVARTSSGWVDPTRRYLLITFGAAMVLTAIIWKSGPSVDPVLSWLIAINVAAFVTYGYDKVISGSAIMRVPESVLLALALPFGTLGALAGMKAFHHKTAKETFQLKFGVVVVIQILLLAAYAYFKPQVFK